MQTTGADRRVALTALVRRRALDRREGRFVIRDGGRQRLHGFLRASDRVDQAIGVTHDTKARIFAVKAERSSMSTDYPSDRDYRLRFGPAATAKVKSTLDLAVRPHLQDVRAMLRLPLPEAGITAGCNFAAVQVLLNVLSGLSRLMGPTLRIVARRSQPLSGDGIHGHWNLGGLPIDKGAERLFSTIRSGTVSPTIWVLCSRVVLWTRRGVAEIDFALVEERSAYRSSPL